jgi:hypothetical protein
MTKINLAGHRFGRLIVIGEFKVINKKSFWLCRCDCGQSKFISASHLVSSHTLSCGCLNKEKSSERYKKINFKHGLHGTREYRTWRRMIQRCYDKNDVGYKYYGGRGISVCDRWRTSFELFLEDMGKKPVGLSIERINNNCGYSKENCKWATSKEQANNRSNNRIVSFV